MADTKQMKIQRITIEMQDFDNEAPTREYPRCDVCGALMHSRCTMCADAIWIMKTAVIRESKDDEAMVSQLMRDSLPREAGVKKILTRQVH